MPDSLSSEILKMNYLPWREYSPKPTKVSLNDGGSPLSLLMLPDLKVNRSALFLVLFHILVSEN